MHLLRQKHSATPRATYFACALSLYSIISFKDQQCKNIAIMHEQSKWHEAQPSASDEASALLLLSNLGRKHILMAWSEAEGPNLKKILISFSQIRPRIGKCRNNDL